MSSDPATAASRRPPAPALIVLAGGVLCGIYLLPMSELHQALVDELTTGLMTVFAFGGALRRPAGQRLPWVLLALGLAGQLGGDSIWNWIEFVRHDEVAFPSLPDLLYLSGYPLWTLASLLLVRRVGLGRSGAALDSLVLAGGMSALGYHFLIGPYLTDTTSSVLQRLVGAGYPAFDLLLLVGTLLMVTSSAAARLPALRLLAAGFAIGFAGDGVYGLMQLAGTYRAGSLVDLTWLAQYSLIAAAAWAGRTAPGPPRRDRRPSAWRVPGLFVAALAGPVELVLVVHDHPAEASVLAGGTVLLVGLVAVRLGGLLRQVSRQAAALRATLVDRDEMAVALRHQADHDALTGLVNRHALSRQTHELLDRTPAGPHTLIFVDLDGFRAANERLGHPGGDALLASVATRLRLSAVPGELAARLGGDEFVLLLPGNGVDAALARAQSLLARLSAPVEALGQLVPVSASIGVAAVRPADSPELAHQAALSDADLAMYAAKQAGGGRVEVYRDELREELLGAAELAVDLAEAIAGDALEVAYQPLVVLADGRTAGLEALVRWRHPRRGNLLPFQFLPIALERGLISEIDLLVLRHGLAQLADWRARFGSAAPGRLNVNASAPLLARDDFVPTVQRLLAEHRLPGSALTVELTEQVLVVDPDVCARRLHQLRELGVGIALDDFGTGYSSLAYLQRFPVQELKLDRTFIELGTANGEATRLLCAVLELAATMGLPVVAEGIEDSGQRDLLAGLGCQLGQGYLFARPMAAGQAELWFGQRHDLQLSS